MAKFSNNSNALVAKIFKERLKFLGISQYRFINSACKDSVNKPTLIRILRGEGSTTFSTIAHYCNLLGLKIEITPKLSKEETLDKLEIKPKH